MSGFRVNEITAFTTIGDDGDEGVCGFRSGGAWIAMIAADMKRLEILRPMAQGIATATGRKVYERRFTPVSGEPERSYDP